MSGAACRNASLELCDAIAAHAAFLTREFPAERSPSIHQLQLMMETNLGEGGLDRQVLRDLDEARAALACAPTSRIDGRMMPHEWIRTSGGSFVKVDALDHHADHFFPGIQDAGWDLAAAAFEFDMNAEQRDRVVSRYIASSGDRDVRARLPFFDVAYPAFRLGYATRSRLPVEHAVQVDAHDRALRVLQVDFACLRRHRRSWYDSGRPRQGARNHDNQY